MSIEPKLKQNFQDYEIFKDTDIDFSFQSLKQQVLDFETRSLSCIYEDEGIDSSKFLNVSNLDFLNEDKNKTNEVQNNNNEEKQKNKISEISSLIQSSIANLNNLINQAKQQQTQTKVISSKFQLPLSKKFDNKENNNKQNIKPNIQKEISKMFNLQSKSKIIVKNNLIINKMHNNNLKKPNPQVLITQKQQNIKSDPIKQNLNIQNFLKPKIKQASQRFVSNRLMNSSCAGKFSCPSKF